jgi:hypothetical protein
MLKDRKDRSCLEDKAIKRQISQNPEPLRDRAVGDFDQLGDSRGKWKNEYCMLSGVAIPPAATVNQFCPIYTSINSSGGPKSDNLIHYPFSGTDMTTAEEQIFTDSPHPPMYPWPGCYCSS